MPYIHKEGSFTLLSNSKNKTKDTHPDYRGEGTLNGKPAEIAGWKREFPRGGEYISIAIKEKKPVAPGSIKRPAGKIDPADARFDGPPQTEAPGGFEDGQVPF